MQPLKYSCFCINEILKEFILPTIYLTRQLSLSNTAYSSRNCKQINGGYFKFKTADMIRKWNVRFKESGVDEPKLSIENIAAHVFKTRKISDVYKNTNKLLSRKQIKEITKLCKLRLNRMPVQYIIGEWDFRDLTLKMKPPVFIPRPETEQLVELVLSEIDSNTKEILELCCGTGAISLGLLKEHATVVPELVIQREDHNALMVFVTLKIPRYAVWSERSTCFRLCMLHWACVLTRNKLLQAVAIDKSKQACDLTKQNAHAHGLSSRLSILQTSIENISPKLFDRNFKIIVSNPPYIPSNDLERLQPEILWYEDRDALDGGTDGLVLIKLILQRSSYLLCSGGKTFLEVDPSHPQLLDSFLRENNHLGLTIHGIYKDIFGRDRFVIIKKI